VGHRTSLYQALLALAPILGHLGIHWRQGERESAQYVPFLSLLDPSLSCLLVCLIGHLLAHLSLVSTLREMPRPELGKAESPTSTLMLMLTTMTAYREVCSGATGHAEAVRVGYQKGSVGYGELVGEYRLLRISLAVIDGRADREGKGNRARVARYSHPSGTS
jgi:hypothetical protein